MFAETETPSFVELLQYPFNTAVNISIELGSLLNVATDGQVRSILSMLIQSAWNSLSNDPLSVR